MCSILKVSRSSYYSWLKSGPSKRWQANEHIMFFIQKIFEASYKSYGAPRIKKEIREVQIFYF